MRILIGGTHHGGKTNSASDRLEFVRRVCGDHTLFPQGRVERDTEVYEAETMACVSMDHQIHYYRLREMPRDDASIALFELMSRVVLRCAEEIK